MKTFLEFIREDKTESGFVSAIKYKGQIHHDNGEDHSHIQSRLLKHIPEKHHDKEAETMNYGFYHPKVEKWADTWAGATLK